MDAGKVPRYRLGPIMSAQTGRKQRFPRLPVNIRTFLSLALDSVRIVWIILGYHRPNRGVQKIVMFAPFGRWCEGAVVGHTHRNARMFARTAHHLGPQQLEREGFPRSHEPRCQIRLRQTDDLESSRWNRCSVRIVRSSPLSALSMCRRSIRAGAASGSSTGHLTRTGLRAEHAQGSCHVSRRRRVHRSIVEHIAHPSHAGRHERRGAAAAPSGAGRHVCVGVPERLPWGAIRGPLRRSPAVGRRFRLRGVAPGAAGHGPGASRDGPGACARACRDLRESLVVTGAGAAPRSHEHPWSSGGDRGASPARVPSNRVGGPCR